MALCKSLLPGPPAPKLEAEGWQARLQRLTGIDFFEAATSATLIYGLLLPEGRARSFSAGSARSLTDRLPSG